MTETPLAIRFTAEQIERIDDMAALLKQRAAGARVTRSDVVRIAMERGLAELERELSRTTEKRLKK
jgi:hypothetical protein